MITATYTLTHTLDLKSNENRNVEIFGFYLFFLRSFVSFSFLFGLVYGFIKRNMCLRKSLIIHWIFARLPQLTHLQSFSRYFSNFTDPLVVSCRYFFSLRWQIWQKILAIILFFLSFFGFFVCSEALFLKWSGIIHFIYWEFCLTIGFSLLK